MTFWQGTAFEGPSHQPHDLTDDLVVWVVFV